jgi:hypothetical protein
MALNGMNGRDGLGQRARLVWLARHPYEMFGALDALFEIEYNRVTENQHRWYCAVGS